MEFEGQFCRERFKRGVIRFIDGDVLKGEWGNKRGRWVLKKGVVMEGDKVICEFKKDNKFAKIKLKEIHCDDDEQGFFVRYAYQYLNDNRPIEDLRIYSDGGSSYIL